MYKWKENNIGWVSTPKSLSLTKEKTGEENEKLARVHRENVQIGRQGPWMRELRNLNRTQSRFF